MKKVLLKTMAVTVALFASAATATAQSVWKHRAQQTAPMAELAPALTIPAPEKATQEKQTRATSSALLYLGYTEPDEQIYEYDGYYLQETADVSGAIYLTQEELKPYIGADISQLRVGWSTSGKTVSATVWVRSELNGENLAQGTGTLKYVNYNGWTNVPLTSSYTIKESDKGLYLGYSLTLQSGYFLPIVSPYNVENSCYLNIEGELDEAGNPYWSEDPSKGGLCIMGVIDDTEGNFTDMVTITALTYNPVVTKNKAETVYAKIKNIGSNSVSKIGVRCTQGDQTWTQEVNLTSSVASGASQNMFLPIYSFNSGEMDYTITKVNGVETKAPYTSTVSLLSVPEAVASQYTMRPLMEFFTTENAYQHVDYYNYVLEGLGDLRDDVTLIAQHCEDQFMLGDEDDALALNIALVGDVLTDVYIPAVSMNRTAYWWNYTGLNKPVNHTYYPEAGAIYYPYLFEVPAFASVNAEASVENIDGSENNKIVIDVSGNIAEGVLPDNEYLNLTVYVMEYDVESENQMFYSEDAKEEYEGRYTHESIIRRNMTPLFGEPLEVHDGEYSMHFEQQLGPSWNHPGKMGVVAFLSRSDYNPYTHRNVINSTEARAVNNVPAGIDGVRVDDGSGSVTGVYDLRGVELPLGVKPQPGVYLVKRIVNGKPVVSKQLVK